MSLSIVLHPLFVLTHHPIAFLTITQQSLCLVLLLFSRRGFYTTRQVAHSSHVMSGHFSSHFFSPHVFSDCPVFHVPLISLSSQSWACFKENPFLCVTRMCSLSYTFISCLRFFGCSLVRPSSAFSYYSSYSFLSLFIVVIVSFSCIFFSCIFLVFFLCSSCILLVFFLYSSCGAIFVLSFKKMKRKKNDDFEERTIKALSLEMTLRKRARHSREGKKRNMTTDERWERFMPNDKRETIKLVFFKTMKLVFQRNSCRTTRNFCCLTWGSLAVDSFILSYVTTVCHERRDSRERCLRKDRLKEMNFSLNDSHTETLTLLGKNAAHFLILHLLLHVALIIYSLLFPSPFCAKSLLSV